MTCTLWGAFAAGFVGALSADLITRLLRRLRRR